ncbi:MAG: hypothetical protein A2X57_03000 [Nitrospirae bacterium GWD2_57_8]|nr:MAG: hypothetical protein A2X57_03000 [Nitrospirae bacterium GWD2_57_8]
MNRIIIILIAAFLLAPSVACDRTRTWQKEETIMGTVVRITVVGKDAGPAADALEAAFEEIRRLDRMMSLYKDESEITALNMAAGERPARVFAEMIEVMEHAASVSKMTQGAFDATAGPLIVLWQLHTRDGTVPSEREIERIRAITGWRDVEINKKRSTIFLRKKGMIVDLGGIAKGYAADRAAAVLRSRGIENGIVAVAGDIRVMGRRPDGSPWRIAVQHPREHEKTLTVLELTDTFISTSGDYERFTIVDKKRYHHIIDPRTGRPSKGVISATIIGDRGVVVDPLTTAVFILGPEQGMALVRKLGYDAIMVDEEGRLMSTAAVPMKE